MANHLSGLRILTLNGGSSSLKFAVYEAGDDLGRLLAGKIDRIGLANSTLTSADAAGKKEHQAITAPDQAAAASALLEWLRQRIGFEVIGAVGHRVVHGGPQYREPQRVTPEVLSELRRISPFDPEHMPAEIELIESVGHRLPSVPQVACFDTAFHQTMPRVAQLFALPRRLDARGVHRYGFHGLSYAYLMEELAREAGQPVFPGRVILAHLGNGASMTAVRDGRSVDTTMGFTPTAGLPMSTRSGDLDPGLVWYLARTEGMTPQQFHELVNHRSGLLGISETSPDMQDLLARRETDPRAAEAVAFFCYQARKWIGGFAAALEGLDTLVFSGGIGENAPPIRAEITNGLAFLGIVVDSARNAANAPVISTDASPVTVRVIRTDEEIMIARSVWRLLARPDGAAT